MALRFPENTGGCLLSVLHWRSLAPADLPLGEAAPTPIAGVVSWHLVSGQNQLAAFHCPLTALRSCCKPSGHTRPCPEAGRGPLTWPKACLAASMAVRLANPKSRR